MLGELAYSVKCEVCKGELHFDSKATEDDYKIVMGVEVVEIDSRVDDIISKFLVYRCTNCGQKYRYTYKDIEKIVRRNLTEKVLLLLIKDQIPSITDMVKEKFYIYCGKCPGIDGTGCCTRTVYNSCDIKRFPINGL